MRRAIKPARCICGNRSTRVLAGSGRRRRSGVLSAPHPVAGSAAARGAHVEWPYQQGVKKKVVAVDRDLLTRLVLRSGTRRHGVDAGRDPGGARGDGGCGGGPAAVGLAKDRARGAPGRHYGAQPRSLSKRSHQTFRYTQLDFRYTTSREVGPSKLGGVGPTNLDKLTCSILNGSGRVVSLRAQPLSGSRSHR